jgi:ACS family hexuronate transporter-like MFS transporter
VLIQRGFRPPDARKWLMVLCAVLIPCGALLVTQVQTSRAIVLLMAVIAFAEFTWMVTMTALAVDVLPPRRIGRMFGVVSAGSGLGGMIFMYAVGRLVTWYSYTPVFVLMGCLHPIALYFVWRIARAARRRDEATAAAGLATRVQPA